MEFSGSFFTQTHRSLFFFQIFAIKFDSVGEWDRNNSLQGITVDRATTAHKLIFEIINTLRF